MPLLTMVLSFPNKTVTSDLDVLTKIMKYDKKYNSPVKYGIATKLRENRMFQRPFLRGLFLEGLTFGGAYLRREICVSKSIGLAL